MLPAVKISFPQLPIAERNFSRISRLVMSPGPRGHPLRTTCRPGEDFSFHEPGSCLAHR